MLGLDIKVSSSRPPNPKPRAMVRGGCRQRRRDGQGRARRVGFRVSGFGTNLVLHGLLLLVVDAKVVLQDLHRHVVDLVVLVPLFSGAGFRTCIER